MDDSVVYVAHHTAMPVLAPAACQDWRRQLHLYHQQGDTVRAMFLWASASRCSIFHPRQASDAQSREDFRPCALCHGPGSTGGASWSEPGSAVAAAVLASNMSGIYALQAMGEDEEDGPAYPEAPAEVVFAYAFASWAEARDAGGQAIADAWSELRKDFEDAEALKKAAAGLVVEGPPNNQCWAMEQRRT